MNTAVTTPTQVRHDTRDHGLGWFASLVQGVRWGIEMRRRYDREVAAGRRPDAAAIRRMSGEVDAWVGARA